MRKILRKLVGKEEETETGTDGGERPLNPELVGDYRTVLLTRATDERVREAGQDGGTTTALLAHALDEGHVDAVVAAIKKDGWKPQPKVITDPDELIEAAGSKYSISPNVSLLNEAIAAHEAVALVGTPCQVTAVKKATLYPYGVPDTDSIALTVGIFCTENFEYDQLLRLLSDMNVDVTDVERMDISKGKFIVTTKDGEEHTIPVKELGKYSNEACEYCTDFTAEDADLSVGSVGAPDGWNVLIVRTRTAEELVESAVENDVLETKDPEEGNLQLVEKLSEDKKTRIQASKCATWRPYHPNIPL